MTSDLRIEMVRRISLNLLIQNKVDSSTGGGSDAELPACGSCTRSHAHMIKLYPNLPLSEPECIYDMPEAISEGLRAKISRLEEEMGKASTYVGSNM